MVERAIEQILNGVPSMNGKVKPVYRPPNVALPCITYSRTGTTREYHARGESGLAKASITVRCHAREYDAAMELADAARLTMAGWRGQNVSFINKIVLADESDDTDDAQFGGNKPDVFRRILSFEVSYTESTQQHIAKG